MENSYETLINEAKQALEAGDKQKASQLADQALKLNDKVVDGYLVKAESINPNEAMAYLNAALSLDPNNQRVQQAVAENAKEVRAANSAAWVPEQTPAVPVQPALHAQPKPVQTPRKRYVLPLVIGLGAILLIGCYKAGVFQLSKTQGNPDQTTQAVENTGPTNQTQIFATAAAAVTGTAQKPSFESKASSVASEADLTKTPSPETAGAADPSKVYVPIVIDNSGSPSATQTVSPTSAPSATLEVTNTIPVIQVTPISKGEPTPVIITSVLVDEESGQGSLVTPPADAAIPEDIPEIPVTEVSPEEAAPYLFNYDEPAQPVVSYGEKWIDINLSHQMLYAYEGDTLVGSFLVSTGTAAHPTVTGTFRTYVKYLYTRMRGEDYDLADVPYTMYFYEDYGIHGTYWHHNFGTPMSHGCINMETSEAGWLYEWAPLGTVVNIHY